MSIGRRYVKGERVLIDPAVLIASPERREPSHVADVLIDSPSHEDQVYINPMFGSPMYVFKNRIKP